MDEEKAKKLLCGEEILCLPANKQIYAVEFSYIVEICYQVKVSPIPCLPERFPGLYNYKGMIIPVVRLEAVRNTAPQNGRNIVVVVKVKDCRFGILTEEEPFILPLNAVTDVESPVGEQEQDGWCLRGIYRWEGGLFSAIDIEKSTEELIVSNSSDR